MSLVGLLGVLALGYFQSPGQIAKPAWSSISLDTAEDSYSRAFGVSDGRQVGFAPVQSGVARRQINHAALWRGDPTSKVDLHPSGAIESTALAVDAAHEAGYVVLGITDHASLWTGSAASWIDLSPAGSQGSRVTALRGGLQVGYATIDGIDRASAWSGSADSWVDLSPSGATASYLWGVDGGDQVGHAILDGYDHAGLWHGTAASWVDLNPPGCEFSEALGVKDGEQVGWAVVGDNVHASLWRGGAGSWVDLNPPGIVESKALATAGGIQVGYIVVGGYRHACAWRGTATSCIDLGFLYRNSFGSAYGFYCEARGVWSDSKFTYVAGSFEGALLWRCPRGFEFDVPIKPVRAASPISDGQTVRDEDMFVPGVTLDLTDSRFESAASHQYVMRWAGKSKVIQRLGDFQGSARIRTPGAALSFVRKADHASDIPNIPNERLQEIHRESKTFKKQVRDSEGGTVVTEATWRRLRLRAPSAVRHGKFWTITRPVVIERGMRVPPNAHPYIRVERVGVDGSYKLLRNTLIRRVPANRIRWSLSVGE